MGKKIGFATPDEDKALQFLLDVADLHNEFGKAHGAGMESLRSFLEAGRFGLWMGTIERSIAGPFYFGNCVVTCICDAISISLKDSFGSAGGKPSYCDFQMAMMFNLMKAKALDELQKTEKVSDLFAAFPKARAVHTAIMQLPSAKKMPYKTTLPEFYYKSAEWAALPTY